MAQTIMITGATAGIGKATAEKFAQNGYRLILTGRRQERLESLAADLDAETLLLNFDVRDPQAVQAAIDGLPPEWQDIDILFNNAGLAVGVGPLQEGVVDDWERMIDTNVKGLLYVSRAVTPLMVKRKSGHVINIASIAGKQVYPGGNVYCATKHAVDALSQGMRIDLLPYGIKVTNLAPGLVETEFSVVRFKGDQNRADAVYTDMKPLTGPDIADVAFFVANTPAHVTINDILVMPTAQASAFHIHRTNE
ncbi:SDR family oxidoreductase [Pontibacter sp. G13]|uniref:SDR family oxidoreductase n=1 Tax=Pontibacter sp. G13 TaxID=3074898 RepID=UPI00288A1372|nr:SDR family oxidoreductase [Pontibacter sp. G13]WNJ16784.1 SDR family oxidoreductase [Pontibacter sp. G13]